jgi:hypothetical protein
MNYFTIKQNGIVAYEFWCKEFNYDKEDKAYIFKLDDDTSLIVSAFGNIILVESEEKKKKQLGDNADAIMQRWQRQ